MHPFNVALKPRAPVFFVLAFLAILVCPPINKAVSFFGLPGCVAVFSVFGLLFWIVDRWAWRLPWLTKAFGTPNLSGVWAVTGETNGADGIPRSWSGNVTIVQHWTSMAISMATEESGSSSTMSSLEVSPGRGVRLMYGFTNERVGQKGSLNDHQGTCNVLFDESLSSATAFYFTGHGRSTVGSMTWTRSKKESRE